MSLPSNPPPGALMLPYVRPPDMSYPSPGSPSTKLLPTPSPTHIQFATYPATPPQKDSSWTISDDKAWTPVPLRTWFWLSLVSAMVLIAIALEVALHFSNKNSGWPTLGVFTTQSGFMHFVYTLPPVLVAMFFVTMWAWTDIEIKKMQPYVDLVHGDAPAKSSLLLDYTRTSNFLVWTHAAANKHYLVALASLMALVALSFQPLAAAMFTVRNTWWSQPNVSVSNLATIGLNQNAQFDDLTSFLSAVGYASASVTYNIGDPSFVYDVYTVAPFELPLDIATNGTVLANTTAIKSIPGCEPADNMQMQQTPDGSGWTNFATWQGCSYTWQVARTTTNFFGTSALTSCNGSTTPPQFSPVAFWFFTYQPAAAASITFCMPRIELWNVSVAVDLASGNLTTVTPLAPLPSGSGLSGNITSTPLDGRAYNGIGFNLTGADEFVLARANATQLQMPAAVFEAAQTSAPGLAAAFSTGAFVQLSTQVYTTYLKLIAKNVYFLPVHEPLTVELKTIRERLWLSAVAVHLLTTGILLLAAFGALIHIFHRAERRALRLTHQPGTIASAVSIGAQTNIGALLAGRQRTEDIAQVLQGKKFRIDPRTMKIVMEGEEGYEFAASPDPRRSVFGVLGLQGHSMRISRRFSGLGIGSPPAVQDESA